MKANTTRKTPIVSYPREYHLGMRNDFAILGMPIDECPCVIAFSGPKRL